MTAARKRLPAGSRRPNPFGAGAGAFAREADPSVTFADAVRRARWIAVDLTAERFSLFLLAQPGMRRGLTPCFDSAYPAIGQDTLAIAARFGEELSRRVVGATTPLWWATGDGAASLAELPWARRLAPAPSGATTIAFPVYSERGPSGVALFSGPSLSIDADALFDVHARCFALFEAVTRIAAADRTGAPAISKREIECLRFAADGYTSEEIAGLLGLSIHTANQHLTNTVQKLGAMNRMHAVAKALRLGLIE